MKKFFLKALVLLTINLLIAGAFLFSAYSKDDDLFFHYTQTESVLGSTPEGQAYDLLVMGSSHGRIFSRSGNHRMVEQILGLKMANIARSGAGIVPEYAYLEYFHHKGNSARTILYFVDPFAFSTDKWNERLYFLTDEPFKFGFLPLLFAHDISTDVIYNYIKSKFLKSWQREHGMIKEDATYRLKYRVEESVKKRIAAIYPDGYSEEVFSRYLEKLENFLKYAQGKGCTVVFVIPPTLLGNTPGQPLLLEKLEDLRKKYHIAYHDYSNAVMAPPMYYNHDHLNIRGVRFFTEHYLKPLVTDAQ